MCVKHCAQFVEATRRSVKAMLQALNGRMVFVVDFAEMPKLPVTGVGFEQKYAEALTLAILQGAIKEPGKYGIFLDFRDNNWKIYSITD